MWIKLRKNKMREEVKMIKKKRDERRKGQQGKES